MPAAPVQVAILGFGAFERNALTSHLKLESGRTPSYTVVLDIDEAAIVIADADQSGVADLLRELGRIDDTVFVGASAPPEAGAWMMRPIDPPNVLRECDRLLRQRDDPNSRPMPLGLPSRPGALRPAPGDGASVLGAAPARRAGDAPRGFVDRLSRAGTLAPDAIGRRGRRQAPPPVLPVRRALLVDDSEIALKFLRRQLEPYEIATDFAYDSADALDCLARQAYGIVFLDVDLGEGSELDGLALCKRIRARQVALTGRMPLLVLVSAFHDAVHQVRGTLAGADAYLAKPLDRDALDRLLTGLGLPGAGKAPVQPG